MTSDIAAEELLGLLLIYVPSAPARQLLGDWQRSRASLHDAHLKAVVESLIVALEQRGPTSYRTLPPKEHQ
jgi:hypothetical protein